MSKNCKYGFGTEVTISFHAAIEKMEYLLQQHGFEMFTSLSLKNIVGDSDVSIYGEYVILGACNAEFAKELFSADPDIGMLMPCNIIIYELDSQTTRVMIKDPLRIMDLIDSPAAIAAAVKVKEHMEEIIDEL
jgi:uncharacterized protein (DUF302 family)